MLRLGMKITELPRSEIWMNIRLKYQLEALLEMSLLFGSPEGAQLKSYSCGVDYQNLNWGIQGAYHVNNGSQGSKVVL